MQGDLVGGLIRLWLHGTVCLGGRGGSSPGGRVSVLDPQGRLLVRWGGGLNPRAPGDFFAPHGIWIDSRGAVYVAEVTLSAGGNRGLVPRDCHSLQKFRPVRRDSM